MIQVKILGIRASERYIVRRLVMAAQGELQGQIPDLRVNINEVDDASEIGRYVSVLILPSLVIDEKTVCSGRVPSKGEVAAWLREAAEAAR
jgi:hypothetical protein